MDKMNIIQFGLNKSYNILSTISASYQSEIDQILDPLSSLIRLAILSFKNKGTKISIHNNRINFQDPTFLQGTLRWSQGDKRTDLHNLCAPILKAIKWYSISDNSDLESIFQFSINGLKNLKEAYQDLYQSNLVTHSLSYYIRIIEGALDKKKIVIDARYSEELEQKIDEADTNGNYNRLKELWLPEEISIINSLLIVSNKKRADNEQYDYLISAIEAIVGGKDTEVSKIILKTATTL